MSDEFLTDLSKEEAPSLIPPNPPSPSIEDTPLGEKGEKALEAWKQRAKEAEGKQKEYETRLKAYQTVDLEKYEQLVKQAEQAEILQAEKEKNWEKLSAKLKETNTTLEQQVSQRDQAIADYEKRLKIQAAYYRNRGKDMESDNPLFKGASGFEFIYKQLGRFVEVTKDGDVTIVNDQGVQWIDGESNQPLTLDQLIAIAESQFPQFFDPIPKPNGTGTTIGRDGKIIPGRMSHEEYMKQKRERRSGLV